MDAPGIDDRGVRCASPVCGRKKSCPIVKLLVCKRNTTSHSGFGVLKAPLNRLTVDPVCALARGSDRTCSSCSLTCS